MIEMDGWYVVQSKGSHKQYKRATRKGRVTMAAIPMMIWDQAL